VDPEDETSGDNSPVPEKVVDYLFEENVMSEEEDNYQEPPSKDVQQDTLVIYDVSAKFSDNQSSHRQHCRLTSMTPQNGKLGEEASVLNHIDIAEDAEDESSHNDATQEPRDKGEQQIVSQATSCTQIEPLPITAVLPAWATNTNLNKKRKNTQGNESEAEDYSPNKNPKANKGKAKAKGGESSHHSQNAQNFMKKVLGK
jgi:hypothetical protein